MASRLNDKKQPAPSAAVQTLKEQCFAEYLTSWVESHEIYE
jgi:hypothetical protein